MMTRSLKLAASAFAAFLTLAAGVPAAHAQANRTEVAKVSVPFSFEIGSKHFAPGTYTISQQSHVILRVEGAEGTALLMTGSDSSVRVSEQGKAVFQRVGGKYFLTQVWNAGSTDHFVCVKTSEFKKAQHVEEASLSTRPSTQPETMTLALLR